MRDEEDSYCFLILSRTTQRMVLILTIVVVVQRHNRHYGGVTAAMGPLIFGRSPSHRG